MIFEEVTGRAYPYRDDLPPGPLGREEWRVLQSVCANPVQFELVYSAIGAMHQHQGDRRRLLEELVRVIRQCRFETPEEAAAHLASQRKGARQAALELAEA